MRSGLWLPVGIALAATAAANEVTVQNDSLDNGGSGTIEAGFVANEKAAAWLTSPCDGNIVAVNGGVVENFGQTQITSDEDGCTVRLEVDELDGDGEDEGDGDETWQTVLTRLAEHLAPA